MRDKQILDTVNWTAVRKTLTTVEIQLVKRAVFGWVLFNVYEQLFIWPKEFLHLKLSSTLTANAKNQSLSSRLL